MSPRRPTLPFSAALFAAALAAIHCGGDDSTGLIPASGGAGQAGGGNAGKGGTASGGSDAGAAGNGGAAGKAGASGAGGAKSDAGAGGSDDAGAGGEAGQSSAGQGGNAGAGGKAGSPATAGQAGSSGEAGASQGGSNAGGEAGASQAGASGLGGTAGAAQGGQAGGSQGGQAGSDGGGSAGAAQGGNAGAGQGGKAGAGQGGKAGAGGSGGQAGAGGGVVGPPRLIIAELRTRGASGGTDELIEIFNPTDSPVSFDEHWTLWVRPSASECFPAESRYTGPTKAKIIPARGSLLLAPSGYDDAVPEDITIFSSIGDAGSVFLTYDGGVQDALCFAYDPQTFNRFISCSGFVCEGTPIQNGPHDNGGGPVSNTDVSLSRKHGPAPGTLIDTGNNATDFEAVASSPRNLAAGPLP